MAPALLFNGLTLGYDQLPAVQNLHTEVAEGSLTAIVGPNGAGKSTLLKGVTGSLKPLAGKLAFGGLDREDVAYLPQQSEIDQSFPLSVVDLVAMGLWREIGPFGWLDRARRARIDAAIAAVLADELFWHLDAPIKRLTMRDIPSPHNIHLLDESLPSVATIAKTMTELMET